MELQLDRQPVAACEPLLNAAAEYSIECDVLLPDHCPDIVKLICCRADSTVNGCTMHKSVFTVEGMTTVRVCYIGEVGGVRKTEYKLPFSKSFDMTGEAKKPIWSAEAEQSRISCRAVSKRRLEMSGAFQITARAFDTAPQQVIAAAEGMGVRLRRCSEPVTDLTGQLLRRFSVTELLNPMPGMPAAEEIVMSDCKMTVTNASAAASKIVIKGEMTVHILYKDSADPPQLHTADYILPLSQAIEGEGIDEDTLCECELKTVSCECAPEEFGEEGQLRLEVTASADIKLFRTVTAFGARDSYSTLYTTENSFSQIKTLKSCEVFSKRERVRATVEMPQGMIALLDCWAQVTERAVRDGENGAVMAVKLLFTAIAATDESEAQATEQTAQAVIETDLPLGCELLGSVTPVSCTGVMEQGKITLDCELVISGLAMQSETKELLTGLAVDTDSPRRADPLLGLIVYYAAEGEDIWDIAKRFGSSPERIMADNDLDTQVLEKDMPLMIPAV